ncbi:MAG: TIGR01459 family HAD-type hydrolase [Alphaproteobacteria bacterium]|nr:TIGR01459 family HAD-type hydrolase [Alphaproteobacteria bacterium]
MTAPASVPPASVPPSGVPVTGRFRDIAARYDAFILDLWGVIHDGVKPFPAAVDCLAALHAAGKPSVFLSNAPRRAEAAAQAMDRMGIPRAHYRGLITSGEAVHRALSERRDPWFARLGRRMFHLGPQRDRNVFETIPGLIEAPTPGQADFVLNTGPDDSRPGKSVSEFEPVLQECIAARLPMVCANPDLVIARDGHLIICAGAIAARYRELGGEVVMRGKPDPAIYQDCFAALGVADKRRVLAVGDSLRTDLAGARAVGIDAVWVLDGIHARELGLAEGRLPEPEAVARLAAPFGVAPIAAMPAFTW